MLKKISLAAALAATFITGSVAVANAGHVGDGGPGSMTDSAALQADYASGRGGYASSYAPAGRHAYGHVPERRIVRSHKSGRN